MEAASLTVAIVILAAGAVLADDSAPSPAANGAFIVVVVSTLLRAVVKDETVHAKVSARLHHARSAASSSVTLAAQAFRIAETAASSSAQSRQDHFSYHMNAPVQPHLSPADTSATQRTQLTCVSGSHAEGAQLHVDDMSINAPSTIHPLTHAAFSAPHGLQQEEWTTAGLTQDSTSSGMYLGSSSVTHNPMRVRLHGQIGHSQPVTSLSLPPLPTTADALRSTYKKQAAGASCINGAVAQVAPTSM